MQSGFTVSDALSIGTRAAIPFCFAAVSCRRVDGVESRVGLDLRAAAAEPMCPGGDTVPSVDHQPAEA